MAEWCSVLMRQRFATLSHCTMSWFGKIIRNHINGSNLNSLFFNTSAM